MDNFQIPQSKFQTPPGKLKYLWIFLFLIGYISLTYATESVLFQDNLIYNDRAEFKRSWQTVAPNDLFDFLCLTDCGIQFTDITGDCYRNQNNQKAILFRQPKFKSDYYFQVEIDEFIPAEPYAQVGLVIWRDADNYIRATYGFINPAVESLAEFDGNPQSKGLMPIYPREHPQRVILRMEVRKHNVTTFVSWDKKVWFILGGFVIPESDSESFFRGIGIIGIGGRMLKSPRFSCWEERKLPGYVDTEFDSNEIVPNWVRGQTNLDWSTGIGTIEMRNGKLYIVPVPGSDFFIGNETYPYLAIPVPQSDTWVLEINLAQFNPFAKGAWNKAGVILWLGHKNYGSVSVVADHELDQMYCEQICVDTRFDYFGTVHQVAFRKRKVTDVYFRIQKLLPAKYRVQVSYNYRDWFHCGEFMLVYPATELRLFASGDIFIQYPNDYDFYATFDYVKLIQ
ncbi:MAG: hypothetical protein N3A72_10635 [bacterium]|nr:hypothetical protein [bacterium]